MTAPVCEPMVTMGLIVELFPSRHPITVYRWNRRTQKGRGLRLPSPDLKVGETDLWMVATILSWAHEKKVPVDSGVLERILSEQS